MEAIEAFGVVLRKRRLTVALTQEQLAFEASIRRNYVSMLELGQNQPTLTMLFTLATALGCAPSDLLLEVEEKLDTARGARRKAPVRGKQRRAPSAKRPTK